MVTILLWLFRGTSDKAHRMNAGAHVGPEPSRTIVSTPLGGLLTDAGQSNPGRSTSSQSGSFDAVREVMRSNIV